MAIAARAPAAKGSRDGLALVGALLAAVHWTAAWAEDPPGSLSSPMQHEAAPGTPPSSAQSASPVRGGRFLRSARATCSRSRRSDIAWRSSSASKRCGPFSTATARPGRVLQRADRRIQQPVREVPLRSSRRWKAPSTTSKATAPASRAPRSRPSCSASRPAQAAGSGRGRQPLRSPSRRISARLPCLPHRPRRAQVHLVQPHQTRPQQAQPHQPSHIGRSDAGRSHTGCSDAECGTPSAATSSGEPTPERNQLCSSAEAGGGASAPTLPPPQIPAQRAEPAQAARRDRGKADRRKAGHARSIARSSGCASATTSRTTGNTALTGAQCRADASRVRDGHSQTEHALRRAITPTSGCPTATTSQHRR